MPYKTKGNFRIYIISEKSAPYMPSDTVAEELGTYKYEFTYIKVQQPLIKHTHTHT